MLNIGGEMMIVRFGEWGFRVAVSCPAGTVDEAVPGLANCAFACVAKPNCQ